MVQEMEQQLKVIDPKVVPDKIIIVMNHNCTFFGDVQQVSDRSL
jgi:hypothetical protein